MPKKVQQPFDEEDPFLNCPPKEEEHLTSPKRPCSWYDRLVQWIQSQDGGGYVHPSVTWTTAVATTANRVVGDDDPTDRCEHRCLSVRRSRTVDLRVNETSSLVESSSQNDGGATAASVVVIPKGQVVLRIPISAVITPSSHHVRVGQYGQDASSSIVPPDWIQLIDAVATTATSSSSTSEVAPVPFLHLPRADVQLALYLMCRHTQIRPYLDSLPERCDQDLPRCWKDGNDHSPLQELLRGSPLLRRVQEQQRHVQEDYETLVRVYRNLRANRGCPKGDGVDNAEPHPIPTKEENLFLGSFADFSHCLAAVTSRAFEGLIGFEGKGPLLIPLLDLCNHGRGRNTTSCRKLTYRYDADSHCVVVVATNDLKQGDPLAITYGAQGNGPLLLNYGFCLPHNLEPDGSSNSVYDWQLRNPEDEDDDGASSSSPMVVTLRAGPKSYSYGGLVRALECIRQPPPSQRDPPPSSERNLMDSSDRADDANRCGSDGEDSGFDDHDEEEKMTEDQDSHEDDCYYCSEPLEDNPPTSAWEDLQGDLDALHLFQASLKRARSQYARSDEQLAKVLQGDPFTRVQDRVQHRRQYYAALLVQSEWRTLYFFGLAAQELQRRWSRPHDTSTSSTHLSSSEENIVPPWVAPDDAQLIHAQVKDLVEVWIQIRYPTLRLGANGVLPPSS